MSALDRLLAEELPTGTFGYAKPVPAERRPVTPWTPAEQAAHYAELARAIGAPYLHVVDETDDIDDEAAA
ncbi:hypothetical protein ACFWCA_32675 [Streptomyces phaeochromogenes]|uniref:hypothetical protein n=1 Tax=Streptomyces phaeochromogenes TaxID=1923 RepID=UPI003688A530